MLQEIILLLIALMVCTTLHEAAHAWVAYKLGDPTPKVDGRVSLNPGKHLDPIGTLMLLLVHFGWGKPVIFNPNNLKHPRRDAALIAFSGPLANLLTAAVITVAIKYLSIEPGTFPFIVLQAIYSLSIVLFLFNLIPLAPLDGSKFIGLFIPASRANWYDHYVSQGPLYLIIMIIADRLIDQISGFSFLGTYLTYGFDLVATFISLIT